MNIEWFGEFVLLFSSGGISLAVHVNFWPPSGENLSNKVGFAVIFE